MLREKQKRDKRLVALRSVGVCMIAFGFTAAQALAQTGGTTAGGSNGIMRVEEDWEAVLNEPGADLSSPQFHTVMSPFSGLDSYYFEAVWNYRELPDFAEGGLQVLAWNGDAEAGNKSFREDRLSSTAETITWTQVLKLANGALTFRIKDGQSTTWSSFGGSETRLSGEVYNLADLSQYTPATSAAKSWITYGANRVNVLRIKEVRYYDAAGTLLYTDSTPKVVYELTQ